MQKKKKIFLIKIYSKNNSKNKWKKNKIRMRKMSIIRIDYFVLKEMKMKNNKWENKVIRGRKEKKQRKMEIKMNKIRKEPRIKKMRC